MSTDLAVFWWGRKTVLPLHGLSEAGMDRGVENETMSDKNRTEPKKHKLERRQLKRTNKKGQKEQAA